MGEDINRRLFVALMGREPTEQDQADGMLELDRLLGGVEKNAAVAAAIPPVGEAQVDYRWLLPDTLEVALNHPLFKCFLDLAADILAKIAAAKNHVTLVLYHPEVDKLSVVFQLAGKETPGEQNTRIKAELAELKGKLQALHFPPDKNRCDCCGRSVGALRQDCRRCWTCEDRARLQGEAVVAKKNADVSHAQAAALFRMHSKADHYVLHYVGKQGANDVLWKKPDGGPTSNLALAETFPAEQEACEAAKDHGVFDPVEPVPLDAMIPLVVPVVPLVSFWAWEREQLSGDSR